MSVGKSAHRGTFEEIWDKTGRRIIRDWLCENVDINLAGGDLEDGYARVRFEDRRVEHSSTIQVGRLIDLITGPLQRDAGIQELERIGSAILAVVYRMEADDRKNA